MKTKQLLAMTILSTAILFLLSSCEQLDIPQTYEIGDIGPGGGVVFFIEQDKYFECSEILGSGIGDDYALTIAKDYRGGGYNDWRLPSLEELNSAYENLHKKGFTLDNYFWTAYKDYPNYPCLVFFNNNYNNHYYPNVRAVRAFKI